MTDAAQQTFHHRIADLLDDVTESAPPVANAPGSVGAPTVREGVDEAALPPFLMPRSLQKADAPGAPAPAATAPVGASPSSLPGTALFTTSAARAAAKAEQATPPAALASTVPTLNGEATVTLETPVTPLPVSAPPMTELPAGEAAPADAAAGAAAVEVAPLAPEPPPGPPISIKGRSDGLVVEIGKGSWSEILAALDDRLQQSASFFRNARVALDLGARIATEAELAPLIDLLRTHELVLGAVRTSTERTFQAALALGLTTTLETAEGTPVADAAPATTNTATGAYFVYRGYLRSGHRLQRQESILVIGDVNPGAEVSSEGDVLVWGRLRGIAHAGTKGNTRAIVAALDLEPTQLRIADVMTIGPDPRPGQPGKWFWRRSAHKRPEIARLVNDAIALEEWDAARPGGLVSLRRGG